MGGGRARPRFAGGLEQDIPLSTRRHQSGTLKLIARSGKMRDYPCRLSSSKARTRRVARGGRSAKNAIVLSRG
jgi:hypothetical protein